MYTVIRTYLHANSCHAVPNPSGSPRTMQCACPYTARVTFHNQPLPSCPPHNVCVSRPRSIKTLSAGRTTAASLSKVSPTPQRPSRPPPLPHGTSSGRPSYLPSPKPASSLRPTTKPPVPPKATQNKVSRCPSTAVAAIHTKHALVQCALLDAKTVLIR